MQVFSSHWFGASFELVPRFAMVIILFIAFYVKRSTAVAYGLIFGLLTDIVYTDIIGVYFFTMAFTAYLMASFASIFRQGLSSTLLLGILGVVLLEFQVYGLYTIIGLADTPLRAFLYDRLFPSLLLNGVFIIVMYFPMRKLFRELQTVKQQTSDGIRE